MNTTFNNFIYIYIFISFISCTKTSNKSKEASTLFSEISPNTTNIHFSNTVKEHLYFNFLNYSYIYNGGGVAIGDINNDGLEDIYFTSNQKSNKLYVNQGDFSFKDITEKSNTKDDTGWSTGVTMVDINNDGWLDIFVCKSGSLSNDKKRENKLYINQKDNTFKEDAKSYGLNYDGFSVQSYFFDMDNDGDLDMYLVNHRPDFRNSTTLDLKRDSEIKVYSTDILYRNDEGKFIDVSKEAGTQNRAWGLSASIGDFNNDGWLDIFVANDFYHPDYLYINNKNGTFTDKALSYFKHTANNSMGSDFADINNDLSPDLFVVDMLAEDHIRGKENMASMNSNSFNMMVNSGYHHQYMTNVLQVNNKNNTFSDIAQLANISKTDWSWAPLIADFNNDGFNDIFVTNGIENDLSNQDFRNNMKRNIMNRKKVSLEQAINMMPSEKLQNYLFKNNGDLTFTNLSKQWGITKKVNSNGAAYADLDNDGDLDLIVNNQSDIASIYKNNSENNYISFSLKGSVKNPNGIGTKITIYTPNNKQSKEVFVARGFQSSVSNKIHFGLGNETNIDSVMVTWNQKKTEKLKNLNSNQHIVLEYKNAVDKNDKQNKEKKNFTVINSTDLGIDYVHKENKINDFDIQLLLPQKQSEITNALAVGDVNNDNLDDFFVGNAKGAQASLYIQQKNGTFKKSNASLFNKERNFEDTNALFFDADNDGDLDLYVSSGGYEIEENNNLLQDRLYLNNGKGKFTKSNTLPNLKTNTKAITAADFDKDGDVDLFVGTRVTSKKYPLSSSSYLLENINGTFKNVTATKLAESTDLKMVNDALFVDYDNDGDDDLIVVGEWMPITIFENRQGTFIKKEIDGVTNNNGWYQAIKASDLDKDGNIDFIVGNWGKNNKFHPSKNKPLHIYADYFDENSSFDIALSKVSKTGELLPVRGKECSSQQTPFLNKKVKTFKAFAASTMSDIYGAEKLAKATHYKAHTFETYILKNNGDGNFTKQSLPNVAQFSPTLSIEVFDVNKDGILDIYGIGNIYDSEVETIRYDASQGYVLLGDKNGTYKQSSDISYYNNNESKEIQQIIINNIPHFIILNKNSALTILKVK